MRGRPRASCSLRNHAGRNSWARARRTRIALGRTLHLLLYLPHRLVGHGRQRLFELLPQPGLGDNVTVVLRAIALAVGRSARCRLLAGRGWRLGAQPCCVRVRAGLGHGDDRRLPGGRP